MKSLWYWEVRFFVRTKETSAKQVTMNFEARTENSELTELRRIIDTISNRFEEPEIVYGFRLRQKCLVLN